MMASEVLYCTDVPRAEKEAAIDGLYRSSLCILSFIPGGNFWSFGLGFLDGYYTSFTYEPEVQM